MVAERDGLCGLEMGEAGHDAVRMLARAGDQRPLQSGEAFVHPVEGGAHPQAEIGRHLIIAAARGVEASGGRADQLGQSRLGGHVDVFEVPVLGHAVALVFGGDRIEPGADRLRVLGSDDALRTEHRDMGLGGGDILAPERLVERDRGVDFAHDGARAVSEAAAPHCVGRSPLIGACHVPLVVHSCTAAPAAGGLR